MAESSTSQSPSGADPRFQYSDITPPAISVAMWDKIAASVFDPSSSGPLALVKACVLAAFATMYVVVRERLASAEQLVAKQRYEQSQGAQDTGDANNALPPKA